LFSYFVLVDMDKKTEKKLKRKIVIQKLASEQLD